MVKNITRRPRPTRAPGIHRGHVVPAATAAEQRQELEDLDHLLAELIRQNRRLRLRVDRIAKAVTGLGESEVDTLLKNIRKRVAKVKVQARRPVARPRRKAAV